MTQESKYRLYYNSDGSPRYYSMENLKGTFIYVDQQTFENSRYDIQVINGKIRSLSENIASKYRPVLTESETTIRTDPTDISIVVGQTSNFILWDYTSSI
jgi:hypothetical protein